MLEYSRPDVERVRLWGVFRQRLRELGYVEGDNITFESPLGRWQGRPPPDSRSRSWSESRVHVISYRREHPPLKPPSVRRTTIPIVMAAGGDPVALGTCQQPFPARRERHRA